MTKPKLDMIFMKTKSHIIFQISIPTVTLPEPTVARQSVSNYLEILATLADCRPKQAPTCILADFLSADDFLLKHAR